MHFYYNPHNKKYGRMMRNQNTMTETEGIFRNLVLKGDKTGYRFLRQKLIGNYILDFYCAKLKLCIEIDDKSHDFKGEDDETRTKYLNNLGIKVIRYTNDDVKYNLDGVILNLTEIIQRISIQSDSLESL